MHTTETTTIMDKECALLCELSNIAAGENAKIRLVKFIEDRMCKLYSELQPPAPSKGMTLTASEVVVNALAELDVVRATLATINCTEE